MKLTGKENHKISLEEARRFTSVYRAEKAQFMTPDNIKHKEAKKGGFFGKDAIIELLNQPDCIGIRYYYGRSDDGMKNLILVGVNKEGNDILPKPAEPSAATDTTENMDIQTPQGESSENKGIILEKSLPCPPFCGSRGLES